MMAHRTAQMDKMKKIVACDITYILRSGTWGRFSPVEYLEVRQILSTFSY